MSKAASNASEGHNQIEVMRVLATCEAEPQLPPMNPGAPGDPLAWPYLWPVPSSQRARLAGGWSSGNTFSSC
jgi:hypothetical protein